MWKHNVCFDDDVVSRVVALQSADAGDRLEAKDEVQRTRNFLATADATAELCDSLDERLCPFVDDV